MLDSLAPVPLYVQIAARLRAQVKALDYPPGARLPSEHELAARFAVGRPTVRQATELLVREQLLERRRGSGTYVTDAPRSVDVFSAAGTLAALAKSGKKLESRLIGRVGKRAVPAGAAQPFSGQSPFFVVRKSALDGEPVLLEEMYFDPAVFPGLDRQMLEHRSLSELAASQYLLRPETAEQTFQVVRLKSQRAKWLDCKPGATALKVCRTVHFSGAPSALFAELYCLTERVAFSQVISLTQSALPKARAAVQGTAQPKRPL